MRSKPDNKESNHQTSIFLPIKWILTDKESLPTRILLFLGAMSSLILLFDSTISFSCQLSFVQNILLAFFVTSFATEKIKSDSLGQRIKMSAITGLVSGGFMAAVFVIVNLVRYYWFGSRETAYIAGGNPVPTIDIANLYSEIGSMVVIWVLLTMLSTMIGVLAGAVGGLFPRFCSLRWAKGGSEDERQSKIMTGDIAHANPDEYDDLQAIEQENHVFVPGQEEAEVEGDTEIQPEPGWLWPVTAISIASCFTLILWLVVIMMTKVINVRSLFLALLPAGDFVTTIPQQRPMADGRAMGDPNALVFVEVFGDFQCSVCAIYTEYTENQLVGSTYITDGQVYYVYRHFPFIDDSLSAKESDMAANASMCAMEQGRFWDYHDMLFANQNGENQGSFRNNRLLAFAEALGLNQDAFRECFEENRYQDEVDRDIELGNQYYVTGTPTVMVNGNMITPGYMPAYSDLVNAINTALANEK